MSAPKQLPVANSKFGLPFCTHAEYLACGAQWRPLNSPPPRGRSSPWWTRRGRATRYARHARPGRSYGRGFTILFDDARREVLQQLNTVSAFKVFLALPDHLSFTEFRPLNRNRSSRHQLGIDGASVSRAMKDLLNRKIVERKGRGPVTQWKLSFEVLWRGNAAAYHAAAREHEARRKALNKPERPALNAAEDILC